MSAVGGVGAATERVPLRTVLAYGPPVFALSGLLFLVQFFFLKYATDVLLLAPGAVGIVFALGRAWDAVSDPIVGTWSDRTRSALGRRRPWMLAALPLLAVSFSLVWIQPSSLPSVGRLAWAVVALLMFYTAFTTFAVPHQSLGAELTTDHHDRSRVFGVYHVAFTIGMLLAFGAMQYVNNADDPRAAAAAVAGVAVVLIFGVLSIPPTLLRERTAHQGRGAENPLRALRDVASNPHARILLAVQFVQMMGAGVLGLLSPYVLEYVIKRPDMIAPLPAAFIVFSVASVPLWLRAARRFGKRNVWCVSMLGFALSFGATYWVAEGDVVSMGLLLVTAGLSAGCGGAVGPSILADVIDYDELRTGERKEGAYSAAWGFAIKASNALVIVLTGFGLELAGFQPNQEQSETAKTALRILFAVLPFTAFLAGALVLSRLRLGEAEHAEIRRALAGRAEDDAG